MVAAVPATKTTTVEINVNMLFTRTWYVGKLCRLHQRISVLGVELSHGGRRLNGG